MLTNNSENKPTEKLHHKLERMIKERGYSLSSLHRKIQDLFEENAIAYLTLLRIIHGRNKIRETTLFQIASALGVSARSIRENTEDELPYSRFVYNESAMLEVENTQLNFLTARLHMEPQAKTTVEQDPKEHGPFTKWIYALRGKITCHVMTHEGLKTYDLAKNESCHFDSTLAHHFENRGTRRAMAIIIQNPKYI